MSSCIKQPNLNNYRQNLSKFLWWMSTTWVGLLKDFGQLWQFHKHFLQVGKVKLVQLEKSAVIGYDLEL